MRNGREWKVDKCRVRSNRREEKGKQGIIEGREKEKGGVGK